jgi:trigger factor
MSELKVSIEAETGLERRIRVEVPADRIDSQVSERMRAVGKSAKLKGFRPGKVPAQVIEQRYGSQVRQEVLQDMVQSGYSEAIDQQKLRPVGSPRIEPGALETGKDFSFTATFEIYPDFAIKGLDKLKVVKPETEVKDEDLDDMLDTLRQQRVAWSPVERKAVNGDRVTVDYEGSLNGEAIENGRGEKVPVVLGDNQMLPDFEKNLIGTAAGDEKTFTVKFPKDYGVGDLAGNKVSFDARISEVAEPQLPEVDEEFIRGFGIQSGKIEDFRSDVRDNMKREVAARTKSDVKDAIMDQLLKSNPIDIPAALVDNEAARLQAEAARNLGISDPAQMPAIETYREAAQTRVRLGLLIGAVIEENKLVVDRERVKEKIEEIAAAYEQPEEAQRVYFQNPQLMNEIESLVIEEQVLDFLLSRAKVETKVKNFSDLMNG